MIQRVVPVRATAAALALGVLAACSSGHHAASKAPAVEQPVSAAASVSGQLPALRGAPIRPDVLVTGRLTAP